MAKLYGKGTITEIVKGKKYRLALSAGKDPMSGLVYKVPSKVPDEAFAIDDDGNPVKPRITYGNATPEQKANYSAWQTPVTYLRHQETFLGTKRQAQLRIEEIRRELENGKAPNADRITFAEWCEQYLSTREDLGKHRKGTLKKDRSHSKHLVKHLGSMRLADITPAVVSAFYISMRKEGASENAVLEYHRLLKRVIKSAFDNDLITRNPMNRVETPKNPKPKRNSLSTEDARRMGAIVTAGTLTSNEVCVFLGLSLGARLGEVLGLTWGHIDLNGEKPFIHIVQQHTRYGERTALKTDADDNPVGRIVPLDASTTAVLRSWKATQRTLLNELGIEQGTGTPVITNALGTWTSHSKFEKWWRDFCVRNGFGKWVAVDSKPIVELEVGCDASAYPDCIIEWRSAAGWHCDENGRRYSRTHKRPTIKRHYEGLSYHELRHTHFTMRLASGMDIPTAQALGGWSTPAMLMNVYAHPVNENIWNAAGFMDKLTEANQSEEAYRSDQQSPSSDILSAAKQGRRTA